MRSILGWLLLATAPFFAAATKGKRKSVKKPPKKKATSARAKKPRAKKAKSPSARSKRKGALRGKKRETRGRKNVARARATEHAHPMPVAAAKPAEPEPPPKPVAPTGRAILLSPENEKYADSVYPTFRWLSVGGATRYEVTWSEDIGMNSSYSIFSIATEATVPVEKPLRVGATYYWRVRGGNESGWGPWSGIAFFRALEEAT